MISRRCGIPGCVLWAPLGRTRCWPHEQAGTVVLVKDVTERVRHAALTGTAMIVSGLEAKVLLKLIQRGE